MRIKNKKVTENYEVGAPYDHLADSISVGEFTVSPCSVRCDEPHVLKIKYKVGKPGIKRGGGLQIRLQGLQSDDPAASNFIAVSSNNPKARFSIMHKGFPRVGITTPDTIRANVNWHAAILHETDLAAGDIIEFTIGTEEKPRVGPQKRRKFKDTSLPLIHYINVNGDGDYMELANSPSIEALPAEADNLRPFLPTTVKPGQILKPRTSITDKYGNVVEAPAAAEVSLGEVWDETAEAPASGVIRVAVRSPEGVPVRHKDVQTTNTITTGEPMENPRTNPVKVTGEGEDNIYWGDIHFHSNFSDDVTVQGIDNRPEECYQYGREVSALDFACLTDHYHPIWKLWPLMRERGKFFDAEIWEESKSITDGFNKPGEFVTFFGYEYRTRRGDTNIYFRDRDGAPLLSGQIDTMRLAREYCADLEFFSAPHLHPYSHQYLTFGPWKWGADVVEQWGDIAGAAEPVIEIFSRHGRYEFYNNQPLRSPKRGMTEGNSVQAHLLRGHRFGFYCGSDDHWGRPGQDGLIAVYAPELTREAVFEAIKNRRCYGSTNARIILDFQANGRFMGEECFSNDRTRIRAEAHGTDILEKVEVIRDGRIIHSVSPDSEDCEMEFEDEMAVLGSVFYYLRVLQRDGHMAWSSPVWVTSTRRIEDMHGDIIS